MWITLLSQLRYTIIVLIMAVASVSDIMKREVSDLFWLVMIALGTPLMLIQMHQQYTTYGLVIVYHVMLSICLSMALALLLYYVRLIGGADSKALIALALSIPLSDRFPFEPIPYTPIVVYINACIMSLLMVPVIMTWNIYVKYLRGVSLFKDYVGIKWTKKLVILFTAMKVKYSIVLREKNKFMVLDRIVDGRRELSIAIRLEESEEELPLSPEEYVWASPTMPFILFMTIGLVLEKYIGNLALIIALWLLSILRP
ncbi:MAG: hypothetical protein DRN15_00160 [Thermoprotei archaeon]|nr:MAG: hypothetical protein DRN15_00160 [Thermoprotei archaeon]RLF25745.1 MAG: hypothetical protein DRM97_00800 [Thermoprotei archaeon]